MKRNVEKVDRYIDGVQYLPPAPTLLVELLELFNDPDRDIDRVVEAISLEPALTAEVLRRCNSALLGGSRPAADIFAAVSRLGFYEIYMVVAALFAARAMALPGARESVDIDKLWRHSVIVAVVASALAKHLEEPEAVAFTAGLLHDVGKLILASAERAKYARLLRQAGSSGPGLIEAERAAFGADHVELGGRLLVRWSLPPSVVVAVQRHHALAAKGPFERLAGIVHLANVIAHRIDRKAVPVGDDFPTDTESMTRLQLKAEDVAPLLEETKKGLERVKGLMDI